MICMNWFRKGSGVLRERILSGKDFKWDVGPCNLSWTGKMLAFMVSFVRWLSLLEWACLAHFCKKFYSRIIYMSQINEDACKLCG